MILEGNTILITGGASGIGLGLAEAFKKFGNEVIVAGRSLEKLEYAASKGLKTMTVDVGDRESLERLALNVIANFPSLNVVIHNAGIMQNEKLTRPNDSQAATDTVMTNILGPIYLSNFLLPHLLKQKNAAIITVTSGLAFMPMAMSPTYCASKAAIHSYTESLRFQLKGTSVEVKEIIPPYVATSLMGERQAKDPHAMPLEEFVAEVMMIFKQSPKIEEIAVKNVQALRDASYQGKEAYQEFFLKRNDMMMNARKAEWDAL